MTKSIKYWKEKLIADELKKELKIQKKLKTEEKNKIKEEQQKELKIQKKIKTEIENKEKNKIKYEEQKECLIRYMKEYYKRNTVIYKTYQRGAMKRNFDFELSLEEFDNIRSNSCYYCGETEKIGIDRRDNDKGYTIDNCVPCCSWCNRMKSKYSENDFINHCIKILEYQNNKNKKL